MQSVTHHPALASIDQLDPDTTVTNLAEQQTTLVQDEMTALLGRNIPPTDSPWYQKPSVYWMLIPYAFSAFAHGGVIVPRVNLFISLVCRDYYLNHHHPAAVAVDNECRVPDVQSAVASFKLLMSITSGLLAAIIAPRLGAFSDRYGRIKILVYINTGTIINELFIILCAKFPNSINYRWAIVGSIFEGLSGSQPAAQAIAHSYAADCTHFSHRNTVFGLFHGLFAFGMAAGPVSAGWVTNITGDITSVFYIAALFHLVFLILLLFFITESISESRQNQAKVKHERQPFLNSSDAWSSKIRNLNIFEPLKILWSPERGIRIHRNIVYLAIVDTVSFGITLGARQIILLYSNFRFGWDQWTQSKFASIVASCRVSCLIVFFPLITKVYHLTSRHSHLQENPTPGILQGTDKFELKIVRFAMFADTIGYLMSGLSTSGSGFTLSGIITATGAVASPTLQAALTKHVPKDSIGQLLGAMGLLHAIAKLTCITIFMSIYVTTVNFMPQAYFFVLTSLFTLAFGISWLIRPGKWQSLEAIYRDQ